MITSFVNMEATQDLPQQPNPNIHASVRLILLFLKTVFTDIKKSEIKNAFYDSHKRNPMFLLYFMYITLLNMTIPSSDRIRDKIAQISIEEWERILHKFLHDTPRKKDFPWTDEEKDVWVLILYFISYQERTSKHRYLQIKDNGHCDTQYSQLVSLGLKAFKKTLPISRVISFLKTVFTNDKKSDIKTALLNESLPPNDPMFLLYFMYIALLDKNLARSKRVPTFSKLKSIMRYDKQTKIENWEIILLKFLEDTPMSKDFHWTDEEKEVWKLVLFFMSEQFGSPSITGKGYCFMLENQERREQLSPLILQLGLKPFKETATSPPENPCAKKYQTVMCRFCDFHGDPKDPSKTCRCCHECCSRDADCKRCRICGQHDSTKCTCCKICNTSAEDCRKCQECNEHDECSC